MLEKQKHDEEQAKIRKDKASYNEYRDYMHARMTRVLYHS
jgi:hypothetical protein